MTGKQKWVFVMLAAFAIGVLAPGEPAWAARRLMVVGTAPAGSAAFPYMVGVTAIVNKEVPELALSPQETGGSVSNIRLLDEGKIEVSGFSAMVAVSAIKGEKPFKKKRNVRVLWSMYQHRFVWFGRKASGIAAWEDVAGKKLVVGSAGGSTRVMGTLVAKAKGMDAKAKLMFLRPGAMISALRDGTADAGYGIIAGASIAPWVRNLLSRVKVNIYGVDMATVNKIIASRPGVFPGHFKAGFFKGKGAFSTVGEHLVMGSAASLDNDTAYKMVKAVHKKFKKLRRFTPTVKGLKPSSMVKGVHPSVPFHPGAIRFFKEKGMM